VHDAVSDKELGFNSVLKKGIKMFREGTIAGKMENVSKQIARNFNMVKIICHLLLLLTPALCFSSKILYLPSEVIVDPKIQLLHFPKIYNKIFPLQLT
jgi:hypothetical protein